VGERKIIVNKGYIFKTVSEQDLVSRGIRGISEKRGTTKNQPKKKILGLAPRQTKRKIEASLLRFTRGGNRKDVKTRTDGESGREGTAGERKHVHRGQLDMSSLGIF